MTPAATNIQLMTVIERGRLFIRMFNAFVNLPRELPIAPVTLGPHPVLSLRQKLDLFRSNSNHLYLGCLGGRCLPDVVAHSLSRRVGKGYALVPVRRHLRLVWAKNPSPQTWSYLRNGVLSRLLFASCPLISSLA